MVSCLTQNKAYGCLHWELTRSKSASYQQIKACVESWVVEKSIGAALKKKKQKHSDDKICFGRSSGCKMAVFSMSVTEKYEEIPTHQLIHLSRKVQLFNACFARVLDLILAKIHYTNIHRNSYGANFKWLIPWPPALTFIETQMLTSSL